jgi:hypothetical protein
MAVASKVEFPTRTGMWSYLFAPSSRGRTAIEPSVVAQAGTYGTEVGGVFTEEGSFGAVTSFVSKWKVGIAAQPIGIPG